MNPDIVFWHDDDLCMSGMLKKINVFIVAVTDMNGSIFTAKEIAWASRGRWINRRKRKGEKSRPRKRRRRNFKKEIQLTKKGNDEKKIRKKEKVRQKKIKKKTECQEEENVQAIYQIDRNVWKIWINKKWRKENEV